jgi:hypothetical protein
MTRDTMFDRHRVSAEESMGWLVRALGFNVKIHIKMKSIKPNLQQASAPVRCRCTRSVISFNLRWSIMNSNYFLTLAFALLANAAAGFSGLQPILDRVHQTRLFLHETDRSRRSLLVNASVASLAAIGALSRPDDARAAVGSLPELQDANAVLQGLTIKVTDPSQQKQMISFLQDSFEMEVLRGTPDGLDTVSHGAA